MNNPDSYYDPPDEIVSRCECGHRDEEHLEDATDTPDNMLDDLKRIADALNKPNSRMLIEGILDQALAVCQRSGCYCRKFVERDPNDDGDYAFDSARDALMERKA